MGPKYRDGLNFLGKLNGRRVLNLGRLLVSYYYSRLRKKNHHRGMPFSVSVEPTTSCNLRCPQCPSGLREFSRPTGMLETDLFRKVVDQLAPDLAYLTLYFQGEPYLNPGFFDMVRYAHEKRIYVATSTNAHYLDEDNCRKTVESGLDRLIISIDGTDQEQYSSYRVGGNLERVLTGTRNLVEMKRKMKSQTPYIIWQFIVFSHNEHQIPEIQKMSRDYEVDHLALKSAQIYDFENGSELIPKNSEFSRYRTGNGLTEIKNPLLNHCWRMWQGCVITWDGRVVPCCFDKDAEYNLGMMSKNSFDTIWNGPGYQRFRSLILQSRKHIDICRNCTEGTKVWL